MVFIIQSCISHTISTTEDRTEEGSAIDIQRNIAVGLTEGGIVAGSATIRVAGIILVGASSSRKDTVLAMEDTAIDGKRYCGFSLASIYVTTCLTWDGTGRCPQSRTHITATSGIDAVNLPIFIFRAEDTIIDDDLGVGLERIYIGISMISCVIAMVGNQIALGN